MYKADDTETSSSADATKLVYTIELNKFLSSVSTSSIVFSKLKSKANVKIELPSEVQ
jgi:hypothetical protein